MKRSVESWFNYARACRSEGTAYNYRCHIIQFIKWLEDRDPDAYLIEDYITNLLARCSKTTANNHLAAIKMFYAWYAPRHHIPDPAADLKLFPKCQTKPKHQRFLTDSEYARILMTAEEGVELDTVEFLANTGLRRSEYHRLIPQDIGETHMRVRGRGARDREVPVNAKVREIVDRNSRGDSLICVSYWKRTDYLWLWCQSLARRGDVPGFGPNALRHYFATTMIKRGVPLKIVSRILGHASVSMTERVYSHILPTDTTGATDCLCN